MRWSACAAAVTAVLLVAPGALAQEAAPPAPLPSTPPQAAIAPEPVMPDAVDLAAEADVEAEPVDEEKQKLVCRSVRDPRTRMAVRKCETVEQRERRLKGGRQAKADARGG